MSRREKATTETWNKWLEKGLLNLNPHPDWYVDDKANRWIIRNVTGKDIRDLQRACTSAYIDGYELAVAHWSRGENLSSGEHDSQRQELVEKIKNSYRAPYDAKNHVAKIEAAMGAGYELAHQHQNNPPPKDMLCPTCQCPLQIQELKKRLYPCTCKEVAGCDSYPIIPGRQYKLTSDIEELPLGRITVLVLDQKHYNKDTFETFILDPDNFNYFVGQRVTLPFGTNAVTWKWSLLPQTEELPIPEEIAYKTFFKTKYPHVMKRLACLFGQPKLQALALRHFKETPEKGDLLRSGDLVGEVRLVGGRTIQVFWDGVTSILPLNIVEQEVKQPPAQASLERRGLVREPLVLGNGLRYGNYLKKLGEKTVQAIKNSAWEDWMRHLAVTAIPEKGSWDVPCPQWQANEIGGDLTVNINVGSWDISFNTPEIIRRFLTNTQNIVYWNQRVLLYHKLLANRNEFLA